MATKPQQTRAPTVSRQSPTTSPPAPHDAPAAPANNRRFTDIQDLEIKKLAEWVIPMAEKMNESATKQDQLKA